MTVSEPLRTILIVLCMGMILFPSFECLRSRPPALTLTEVLQTTSPFWVFALVRLCIDAGRKLERERADREKGRSASP